MPRRQNSGDFVWGSINARELAIRPLLPLNMQRWNGSAFRLSPRKLLSIREWWKLMTNRWSWDWQWKVHRKCTHRCWCDTGHRVFVRVAIFGFGFIAFYSRFTGMVPCPCDETFGDESSATPADAIAG